MQLAGRVCLLLAGVHGHAGRTGFPPLTELPPPSRLLAPLLFLAPPLQSCSPLSSFPAMTCQRYLLSPLPRSCLTVFPGKSSWSGMGGSICPCQLPSARLLRAAQPALPDCPDLAHLQTVDDEELEQALVAAITCSILAAAGHQRSRVLATLYKDERCASLPVFPFLEKARSPPPLPPCVFKPSPLRSPPCKSSTASPHSLTE